MNLLGFYLVSQAIGGVPVCLNHAVDDPWSGAHFPAGYQTVSGAAALAFVRQRHGLPGGDLDRIKREQAFLGSAANKILSLGTLGNPGKMTALLDAVHRSVVLDDHFDLLTFISRMAGFAAGNIRFATVPTHADLSITSTDALAAAPTAVRTLFQDLDAGHPLPAGTPALPAPRATAPHAAQPGIATSNPAAPATSAPTPAPHNGYQVPCVN